MDLPDFKLHPWQQAFMENPAGRFTFRELPSGLRSGRRRAAIIELRSLAANQHEADLAIADLEEHGVAMLDKEGKRYQPPPRPRPRVIFDEVSSVQSR